MILIFTLIIIFTAFELKGNILWVDVERIRLT